MRTQRLYLCLIIFLVLSMGSTLYAQSWQADWGAGPHPISPNWRYDLAHFRVRQDGWLSLSAPKDRVGQVQSSLATSVTLPNAVCFRGEIRLDEGSTKLNHCYILLACYAQDQTQRTYDYVALSIGGGDRHNVSLVSLRLGLEIDQASKRFSLTQESILIDDSKVSTREPTHIRYDIRCTSNGLWSMQLFQVGQGAQANTIYETSAALPIPDKRNTTGVLCLSTKRYRSTMHFAHMRIDPIEVVDQPDTPGQGDEPTPLDPMNESAILLTEVMADPQAGSEEYIELHNTSSGDISLEKFSLLIGRHPESIKQYPLAALEDLPAGAYWVLTTSPSAVRTTYPHALAEGIKELRLPRLSNTGCYIALYHETQGVVDDILYKPSLKQRGDQSRKGVALERISLSNQKKHPDNADNWTSALKSAGYASPTKPNSRLGYVPRTKGENMHATVQQMKRITDLVQELKAGSDATVTLLIHDLLGQCLLEIRDADALNWLESLIVHASTALETLPTIHRGVIVIQLIVRKTSGVEKLYSLTCLR